MGPLFSRIRHRAGGRHGLAKPGRVRRTTNAVRSF